MSEIENPSDQLGGYTDEVISEIKRQKKNNPDLDELTIVLSTKAAVENMKLDCIWRRLGKLNENLEILGENISYLKEED